MKNLLLGILLFVCLVISASTASAQNVKLQGYCEDGGKTVTTQGLVSTTKVQQSYPSCTVTVFNAGTVNPATIFSDGIGTPKSNPFTAASNGLWFFYVPPGTLYDIRLSSGGIPTPFTLGDVLAPGTGTGGGTVTSVNVSGGTTGLTTSGGPVTGAGTITIAGTLDVDNGGTGATTITGVLKGNGTSPFTAAVAGTDYVIPGSILTSGLTQPTARILGRTTAGTGAIEQISIGSGLTFVAGTLSNSGGSVTSINVSGGSTGLAFTGGPITTSGTITLSSGILVPANGGTGINNGSSTITLGGNLVTSGAFTTTLTATGNTNVTLPTSGTLVNSAVTTLSSLSSIGTIISGTWNGSTITAGFGGTGLSSLTPYAILTGGTTATGNFQQVASLGTTGQILTSQGAGALPIWTTVVGSGTVTNSGTLTLNKAVVGNGGVDVRATKLTITDPATTATLTIANNSTFSTAGAFITLITSTADTTVTLPTTGTLVNSAVTTLSSLSSVGTITSGTWQGTAISFANGGTGLTAAADDTVMVSNSTAWQAKTIPSCTDSGGNHLNYDQSTNTFSCGTSGSAASLVVGVSSVGSGTSARVLFDNAGVLGEYPITGTTDVVMSNSPTITTPTISGAISFPDGVRQTFNPNGTTPGFNFGSQAGDPSAPSNGDCWYDSTNNTLDCRINGTTVNVGAGGSGTINSGSQFQIGYYATAGTAISGNSGIVTNSVNSLAISPSAHSTDDGVADLRLNGPTNGGAIVFTGGTGVIIPVTGAGNRFMFIPGKDGAFRAGSVSSTQWDTIGSGSAAFGTNNTATGNRSFVSGQSNSASTDEATAFGNSNTASGAQSFVVGSNSTASGTLSIAMGSVAQATNTRSIAIGFNTRATATDAAVFGPSLDATAADALLLGSGASDNNEVTNGTSKSLGIGFFYAASTGGAAQVLFRGRESTGSPNIIKLNGATANHVTLTASTEASDVLLDLNRTVQFSTGALTEQSAVKITPPTYAFVAASTLTDASTFTITGAPVAGTNATLTNSYSMWVKAGISRFDGNLRSGGTTQGSLGTPANGTFTYCSDCTVTSGTDNTCAGSGTGALAIRLNSVWRCFNAQN